MKKIDEQYLPDGVSFGKIDFHPNADGQYRAILYGPNKEPVEVWVPNDRKDSLEAALQDYADKMGAEAEPDGVDDGNPDPSGPVITDPITEPQSLDAEGRKELLAATIKNWMAADKVEDDWTAGGVPKIPALEAATGLTGITQEERDEAYRVAMTAMSAAE